MNETSWFGISFVVVFGTFILAWAALGIYMSLDRLRLTKESRAYHLKRMQVEKEIKALDVKLALIEENRWDEFDE